LSTRPSHNQQQPCNDSQEGYTASAEGAISHRLTSSVILSVWHCRCRPLCKPGHEPWQEEETPKEIIERCVSSWLGHASPVSSGLTHQQRGIDEWTLVGSFAFTQKWAALLLLLLLLGIAGAVLGVLLSRKPQRQPNRVPSPPQVSESCSDSAQTLAAIQVEHSI
jgi:hypothetical protein